MSLLSGRPRRAWARAMAGGLIIFLPAPGLDAWARDAGTLTSPIVAVASITCGELQRLPPATALLLAGWIGGFYAGLRNDTVVGSLAFEKEANRVCSRCLEDGAMTLMALVEQDLHLGRGAADTPRSLPAHQPGSHPPAGECVVDREAPGEQPSRGQPSRCRECRLGRKPEPRGWFSGMSDMLEELASLAGIEPGYWDIAGQWHTTPAETRRALLKALRLELQDEAAVAGSCQRLRGLAAEAPAGAAAVTCPQPRDLGIGRGWGVTCQAYGLRSGRNAGIGDFADIAVLAEQLAAAGADFLGLSPLHALFPEDPARYSPYAPSSRRWLNELLIAVDMACRDLGMAPIEVEGAGDLRAAALIDYPAVAAAKGAALERLWQAFRTAHLAQGGETELGRAFRAWQAGGGEDLERFCRFQVLARRTAETRGSPAPFQEWPPAWRRPDGPGLQAWASGERPAIDGRAFLQWLAARQLAAAQERARRAGMRIGLYADLATGVVPDGAEAWADPEALVDGATLGAPPDPLGPFGQNWNVVAPSPLVLAGTDAAPLRATLRAAMREAGALRIDHALGLMRLFLIPPGGTAADGAYVRYPYARLLRAVAEEARASGCIVIGEDLGTVPDGFRGPMLEHGLLGYRVAWFERDWHGDQRYLPPERFPVQAMATVSTHDLPTVRGFFVAHDIGWRERLGLYAEPGRAEADRQARQREAGLLLDRLRASGLLGGEESEEARTLALHAYLGRSASVLAAVQLDDLAGELEQPNLPGTITEHPNWRRRCPLPVDAVTESPLAARILAIMRAERPR